MFFRISLTTPSTAEHEETKGRENFVLPPFASSCSGPASPKGFGSGKAEGRLVCANGPEMFWGGTRWKSMEVASSNVPQPLEGYEEDKA